MRALLALIVVAVPSFAAAEVLDRPTLMQVADDGSRTELPLVRGAMHVDVRGPIGQVQVTQTFANPSETPIEAVYVFPLPDDAAIGGLELRLGKRTIRAELRERDDARQTYEDARDAGKTAALLEQERPNVFTQTVANILPGEEIEIALVYDVLLAPVDGQYELALPTTIGPRYQAPPELDPPYAAAGTLSGNLLVVDLDVDAGLPITDVVSPTHAITVTDVTDDHVLIALTEGDAVADRDFVLRWTVEVDQPTLAVLADRQPGATYGHLALVLQPPATTATTREARELVFVVDTSGSMDGEPLALARRAMRWALDQLQPGDAFRILNFSTDVAGFDDGAVVEASRKNVRRAKSWVNGLASAGGTEMLRGIEAALPGAPADGRTRYVCFMTDGYIGNETEILDAVKARRDDHTHLFSFGVGSSVNRYLLDGLAEAGEGVARYLLLDDEPQPQIEAFFAQVEAPMLGELTIDWGGLAVDDAPTAMGALFAGQPVVVTARYTAGGDGTIKVRAVQGGKPVVLKIPVRLPDEGGDGDVLGRLWARRQLAGLTDAAAVTKIALAYGLMSAYTSFVAVDERGRTDGSVTRIEIPLDAPAGVATTTGRTFGSVLSFAGSSSAESVYYVDGVSALATDRRWRGSVGVLAGVDRDAGGLTGISVGYEHRLIAGLAAGLVANAWNRDDAAKILSLIATLSRWSLGGVFDLRLGLGVAFTLGGANGVAAEARVAVPLPVGSRLHPELELRFDVARPGDEDLVGATMGVGVRF